MNQEGLGYKKHRAWRGVFLRVFSTPFYSPVLPKPLVPRAVLSKLLTRLNVA